MRELILICAVNIKLAILVLIFLCAVDVEMLNAEAIAPDVESSEPVVEAVERVKAC